MSMISRSGKDGEADRRLRSATDRHQVRLLLRRGQVDAPSTNQRGDLELFRGEGVVHAREAPAVVFRQGGRFRLDEAPENVQLAPLRARPGLSGDPKALDRPQQPADTSRRAFRAERRCRQSAGTGRARGAGEW